MNEPTQVAKKSILPKIIIVVVAVIAIVGIFNLFTGGESKAAEKYVESMMREEFEDDDEFKLEKLKTEVVASHKSDHYYAVDTQIKIKGIGASSGATAEQNMIIILQYEKPNGYLVDTIEYGEGQGYDRKSAIKEAKSYISG